MLNLNIKNKMTNALIFLDLGMEDYKKVWNIQKLIHQKRLEDKISDTLILVEHKPVITIGKGGKDNNILISMKLLKEKGVEFYRIERGGDVTYHGPGQIVGYPIFNIKDGFAGIKPFIFKIEDAVISALDDFKIEGKKKERQIGVWTDNGKICSIGIAVQRWVSFHGFALNVNTDLKYFDLIVPCGLKGIRMTSMGEILKKEVPIDEVKKAIERNFARIFNKDARKKCLEEII